MYRIILIDIDDTLFDYAQAEKYAIKKVFEDFGYFNDAKNEKKYEKIKNEYKIINGMLWKEFEKGNIKSDELKVKRFEILFEKMKLNYDTADFAKQYLKRLSEGTFLFDESEGLCRYLYGKYKIAVITNGMKEVQYSRVENSKIGKYISKITVSDDIGISKPDKEIFEYTLKELGHQNKSDVIMIGDSLTADIQGGINFGIDTCWVNLKNKKKEKGIEPKYTVEKLEELYDIL
ncbi:MAG: YjjG family noncanonical pyrimidine nucleotidase [Leptotrichiaceae bacterium]|nr:YjjG family noncanonical pyrimidine nucleotidase [Leptotrichiaceae bacterium]